MSALRRRDLPGARSRILDTSTSDSALSLVRPPLPVRWLATTIALAFPVLFLALLLVPWQQAAVGAGRVIALAPQEREQVVEAPIYGMVQEWMVQEGDRVKAGDPIATLRDVDPTLLDRRARQQEAATSKASAVEAQVLSYEAKVEAARAERDRAVAEASSKIASLRQKRVAEAAKLQAAVRQLDRVRALQSEGLASQRDLDLAEASEAEARASLTARDAEIEAARQAREEKRAAGDAKVAAAQAEVEAGRAKLADARRSQVDAEVKLSRQAAQQVRAPRDGTVLRVYGGTEAAQLKVGDPLITLVPDTQRRAVELSIDGNDMPLVDKGGEVRLAFEGWPALQFVGLPGASMGTFPGEVAFVDAAEYGTEGKFRVVVVPSEQHAWPEGGRLRQGVRAKGWFLFSQVPLGVELWRQLNGFPPTRPTGDKDKPLLPSNKKPRVPAALE